MGIDYKYNPDIIRTLYYGRYGKQNKNYLGLTIITKSKKYLARKNKIDVAVQ